MDKPQDYEVKYIAEDPSSAMGLLERFTTSAEGIEVFAHKIITEVEEGRADALRVALFMKTMEKIKDRVNERLAEYYLNEAQKHSAKTFTYRGAEISVGPVSTVYDFSGCGHPGWTHLTNIITLATEQRKEIETLLKAIKEPQGMVIDGEPVHISPPVKKQKDGIKISIK